jgi:trigger factor
VSKSKFSSDRIDLEVTESPGCKVEFSATAKPAFVNEVLDKSLAEVRKKISLPGFRKGKVPVDRVQQQYEEQIQAEARDQLLQTMFAESVALAKLFPWNNETIKTDGVEPFERDASVTVEYSFERTPELPKIERDSIEVTKVEPKEVTDEAMAKHLDELRDAYADFEDTEVAKEKDRVICKVSSGDEVLGERETIVLSEEQSPEWLSTPLIGVKVGDTKEITPPAEGARTLTLEVLEVKTPVHPSDETLAERLKMESFDALKEQATKRLEQEAKNDAHKQMVDQLWKSLFSQVPFDLPTSLLEEEQRSRVKRLVNELKSRQLSEEEMVTKEKEIEAAAAAEAEQALRTLFLSRHICDQEKLEVTHPEVLERTRMMLMWQAMMAGQAPANPSEQDMQPHLDHVRLQLIKEKAEEHFLAPFST